MRSKRQIEKIERKRGKKREKENSRDIRLKEMRDR